MDDTRREREAVAAALQILLDKQQELFSNFTSDGARGFYLNCSAGGHLLERLIELGGSLADCEAYTQEESR